MALRTHKMPSERLKKRLFEVDEAMFKGVERQFELIFCILGIE
jgi:hypothetical protein